MLRLFRQMSQKVAKGQISELDAARKIMEQATLTEFSQSALAQACGFSEHRRGSDYDFVHHRSYRETSGSSDGHGNTPLHWAAFKNETECVSLLLRFNADPNARAQPSGWTPLHDAAYSNAREAIELLVDAGAHVDARANSGATPLCFAAQEDAAGAAQLLLQRGANLSTRCAGAPVDGSTAQPQSRFSGYTPLHYCAHYNAHKAARVLLLHKTAKKAMEIPDLNDRLPIHVAVARGSSDVLRELLHAGARVETRIAPARTNSDYSSSSSSASSSGGRSRRLLTGSPAPISPPRGRPPFPESPQRLGSSSSVARTPTRRQSSSSSSSSSSTPVSSPVLRSMIPSQPITSSKPWNCLTQRSIDECRQLISEAEQNWTPDRHSLFTPADRRAVAELLRVGRHLETKEGIFVDLWPEVLSFCGRAWFEVEGDEDEDVLMRDSNDDNDGGDEDMADEDERLSLPTF